MMYSKNYAAQRMEEIAGATGVMMSGLDMFQVLDAKGNVLMNIWQVFSMSNTVELVIYEDNSPVKTILLDLMVNEVSSGNKNLADIAINQFNQSLTDSSRSWTRDTENARPVTCYV